MFIPRHIETSLKFIINYFWYLTFNNKFTYLMSFVLLHTQSILPSLCCDVSDELGKMIYETSSNIKIKRMIERGSIECRK